MQIDHQPSQQLYDGGVSGLTEKYDAELGMVRLQTSEGSWHDPRASLTYALALLLDDGDANEAERNVLNVLSMQERREGDPHYGNFKWLFEDEGVTDLNAVEFVLEGLTNILVRVRDKLSSSSLDQVDDAIRLGLLEIDSLNVHWTYTNIYLLDVHNRILGGQLLDDAAVRRKGLDRLRDWAERTKADGAPHEFNSATYSAVQITALASIVEFAEDSQARELALEMEQLIWRHVAAHWHPPTRQLAGPHSRAYRRDVVGAPDYLKVLMFKLLGEPRLLQAVPYLQGPGAEGNVIVALTQYNCPPDASELFDRVETREVTEIPDREHGLETTTYLTPSFALGSMSQPYGLGEPPEGWPGHNSVIAYFTKEQEPKYGVLYARYLVNDRRVGQFVYESSKEALDLWEEGVWRAVQAKNDVIVAYGLMPRGQSRVHRLRLDIRLLGVDVGDDVLVGDVRYTDGVLDVAAQQVVAIATGDVYIGIRPLEPTRLGHGPDVRVWQDGQELIVSVFNYEGPPKGFWEYRSLGGPFYKGNVKNGVVLRVADRSDSSSLAGFKASLAETPLTDTVDGSLRTVTFGLDREAITLAYDLKELR